MERIDLNVNEREVNIEKMSQFVISIEKMPNNEQNQENFKWFLTNENELTPSNINPIGLNGSTVQCIDNRFDFKFKILEGARNATARFSYKESLEAQENENTPKKEVSIKIKEIKINDIDVFFMTKEDFQSIEVNEISNIDSKEIVLEEKKAKKVMMKGKRSDSHSWFIKNYDQLKNVYFFGNLENAQNGKLTFTPLNEGNNNEGIFEFIIKASEFPNDKELTKLTLIYKNINGYENQDAEKKDKEKKEKEIKIIKKTENSKKDKSWINDCNKYTIPLYLIHLLTVALSSLVIAFSRDINADSLIIDIISKDLLNDLQSGYITEISNKTLNKENSNKETNSDDFIFDKWQGTVDGCGKIENNNPIVTPLETGKKCEAGEEFLEAIPPIEINNYKGFILGARTPSYIKYHDLLYDGSIIKKNETCPEGKKSCGYIDTIYNILCIDNKSECPINYIKIDKTPPEGITHLRTIKGDQINIYYSNNPYENRTGTPFIQAAFKIGEDELCAIPNLYYSNINLYTLDAFRKDYANQCTLKDYTQEIVKLFNYYFSLDTIDNYQLYYDNKIIERINNSKLVKYGFDINKYKNNKLHLYVRTHYGFDKECLENRKHKFDIITQLNKMNGIGNKMETWSKEMLINIGNLILPISDSLVFANFCSGTDLSSIESLGKILSNFVLNIVNLVFSWNALEYDDPGEDEMKCSDIYVNHNYNLMTEKIRKSGDNIVLCFIFTAISLVLDFLGFIYKVVISYCLKEKDSNVIKKYKYKIKQLNEQLLKAQKN